MSKEIPTASTSVHIANEFIDEQIAANDVDGQQRPYSVDTWGPISLSDHGSVSRTTRETSTDIYNRGAPNHGSINNYSDDATLPDTSSIHTSAGSDKLYVTSEHKTEDDVSVGYTGKVDSVGGLYKETAEVVREKRDPITGERTTYKHAFKSPKASHLITKLAVSRIKKVNPGKNQKAA